MNSYIVCPDGSVVADVTGVRCPASASPVVLTESSLVAQFSAVDQDSMDTFVMATMFVGFALGFIAGLQR